MASVVENLIYLIQEHPTKRNESEISSVIPWLRKRSKMLSSQNDAVLTDIVKHCEHQVNERDDVIIRQGERGDRLPLLPWGDSDLSSFFYIILSGTVSVYIDPRMTGEEDYGATHKPTSARKISAKSETKEDKNKKQEGEGEKKEVTTEEDDKENTAGEEEKRITEQQKQPKRIKELDRSKFGKMIVQYGQGESFGEVALIKRDAYRNATIIADEDCDLMLIGEDLYERSLKASKEEEFASISRFIDTHPFFCEMPAKLKKLLEMSLRKESFIFDSILIRQGDPVFGMMFLIGNGQANITVEPHKHPKQYPQLWPFEAGIDIYSIEFEYLREPRRQAILRKYEDPSVWETKSEDVVIRRTEGYAAIERRMKERHIDLCSVTSGEVIGDTEILMNLNTYLYTVKCTANTEVFILDTKNFERLVGKKNTNTTDIIREYVKSKLKTRMEMKNGPLVPLLPYLHFKLTALTLPVEKPLPPLKNSKHLPNKEYQTKHLLNLFKEGKAVLVDPVVPGVHYYKELMLEKAKARELSRRTDESTTANLRAMKRSPRKQPRSLMAIRESLQQMMEAEVITMENKKSKQKFKRMKKKTGSKYSVDNEQHLIDSTNESASSIADSVKGKKTKLKKKNGSIANSKAEPASQSDSNNNDIAEQSSTQKPTTPIKITVDTVASSDSGLHKSQETTSVENKKKLGKPVLITELKRSELDLPAIHEERTEEEILLYSPIPKAEVNSKPMIKTHINTENTQTSENKEEFEINSNRLENVETVMSLEHESDGEKRLILPQLRPVKEKKIATSKVTTPRREEEESETWGNAMKFVNKRIQSRLTATSLDNVSDTFDFESSEPTLRLLESRIQAFHIKYGGKAKSLKTMKLPKLARFDAPKEEPVTPLPGAKVWVKKRSCQFSTNKVRVKDHAHIRHHVVHEIPEFDHVKRTQQVLSILSEDVAPRNEMFT
ncbi:unnamed protein product [Mytilus coruscus]|uniref:Cyclic nucleotide-binding domain-containing protein n=1 Tax=Mytilus coruscus TaxID=42192 RepID=A0A6J8E390_MYTCO|nr:unnamed protein product [Mytilus coruscus]